MPCFDRLFTPFYTT